MVTEVQPTLPPVWLPEVREIVCREALKPLGLTLSPEFLAALTPQPRFKMVTGGWQAGKALALGTEIRTLAGPRRVEDMQVGDVVFDHEGMACRVKAVSPVWEDRKCWRIRFSDQTSVVVDEEHEWLIERTQNWARSSEETPFRETINSRYTTRALRALKLPLRLPGCDLELVAMEETPNRDTQCIEVDSAWHTFQLANGAPTCNSTELAAEVWCETPMMVPGETYLIWIIVPSYRSPHKEIDYLEQWGRKTGILTYSHLPPPDRGQPCAIEFNLNGARCRIETKTAKDIEGIAGEPCDMVIIAEPGQMPETIVNQVQGRVITKRGRIVAGGTIEDAEMKVRFAWYPEMAASLEAEGPNDEAASFRLPSWSNLAVFPGGRRDPEILRLELPPPKGLGRQAFDRRIGGKPEGVEFPVYPQIHDAVFDENDPTRCGYHFDCSNLRLAWQWHVGAGGHDYGEGEGHPSTLVACTVLPSAIDPAGLLVVRDAWWAESEDITLIESTRRLMGQKYRITRKRWAFDPTQREAARMAGAWAATTSTTQGSARGWRVGLVHARLNHDLIRFDLANPRVVALFKEMRLVHKIRKRMPGRGTVWIYNRDKDDLTAGLEMANELIFSVPAEKPDEFIRLPDMVSMPA